MSAGDFAVIWTLAAGVAAALAVFRAWLPFPVTGAAVIALIGTGGYALNHWDGDSETHIVRVFDRVDATLVALAVSSLVAGVVGLIVRHVRKRQPDGVVA